VEINVQFHLFQEMTNQFSAVIVLDNTNQMIQEMTDTLETIEVQEIQEMTDIQNIQEMIEIQEIMIEKIQK